MLDKMSGKMSITTSSTPNKKKFDFVSIYFLRLNPINQSLSLSTMSIHTEPIDIVTGDEMFHTFYKPVDMFETHYPSKFQETHESYVYVLPCGRILYLFPSEHGMLIKARNSKYSKTIGQARALQMNTEPEDPTQFLVRGRCYNCWIYTEHRCPY